MNPERLSGSFRDPHGFLYQRDGVILRQVNRAGQRDYETLRSSGLAARLIADGLLVRHEDAPLADAATTDAVHVLRPERIPFVSCPWEWTFGQLRDAAQLTLRIQQIAVTYGMTLRDASAFNVQWRGVQPVLVDTLSLGVRDPGCPWVAYRQFCRHFLAPLALMARVDVRLRDLWREHLDGVPLDLASRLLPRRTWLAPWALVHLHMHARSSRRYADAPVPNWLRTRRVSERGLEGLLDHLRQAVASLQWVPPPTEWSDYESNHGYGSASQAGKREAVATAIKRHLPAIVWDLGANTGQYSRIAQDAGAYVVALDADVGAVERHYTVLRREHGDRILPLWTDLRNPGPAQGWAHREWRSLVDRGPANLVLALALVHHLAIGNNLPLQAITAFLAQVGRRVIVEWVPKDDAQVLRLLASRDDIFDSYTRERFVAALECHFRVEQVIPLPESGRELFIAVRTS